ncbi:MAG: hypothetical protein HOH43_23270, partial [Candidatus Latescibacteria bacterium]|nr:hypothetical protein [Candidatus Latescibacterota bacterium]
MNNATDVPEGVYSRLRWSACGPFEAQFRYPRLERSRFHIKDGSGTAGTPNTPPGRFQDL